MPETVPTRRLPQTAKKITRVSRIEHAARNIRQDISDIGGRVASSEDVQGLRDDLSRFRDAFSEERRASVEIRTRVERIDAPHGQLAKLDEKVSALTRSVETLRDTVVRTIGWATGALVVSGFLIGLYERQHH